VTEIDVAPNLWEQLHAADPDIVFNALHGDWGEDGRVQGVLDLFGAPYTHSGVMASALAMDKHRSKAVLRDVGINVSEGYLMPRWSAAKEHPMDTPYVVKPNGKALGVTEIIPETEWYDYEAKYADGGSRHVVPADLPQDVTELCLTWAALAHQALGCRGITRSDFRFNDINADLTDIVNKIVMLELNTQPGMTPTSLAPEQAAHDGMTFGQLCRWIVEDASWPR